MKDARHEIYRVTDVKIGRKDHPGAALIRMLFDHVFGEEEPDDDD